jgi:AcrR family transcriptional regulator
VPTATSLSRQNWTDVALRALLTDGPDAVAVQPLARALGATKGSFYWHFRDRDDLLRAALDEWADRSTEQVIADLEAGGGTPELQLRALFGRVTEAATRHPGELRLLAGVGHPAVAEVVAATTRRRVSYVAALIRAAGVERAEAGHRAVLAYATYLGFLQLAVAAPRTLPARRAGRARLLDEMVRITLA